MKKKSKNIDNAPWIFPVFFLFLWEFAVEVFQIPAWILPRPTQIIHALWNAKELIWHHSIQTILEALIGLFVSVLFGIGVAIFMEWSPFAKKLLYPLLLISQTIPFIVLAPLLVIWLGYGITAKIVIVALVCFFPITINFYDGFRSIDTNILRLVHSMKATKIQVFRFLKLPGALPHFFSGIRLSGTYAVFTAVIAEWIGSDRGLGILLLRSSKSYVTDRVFAVVGVIMVLSLIVVFIIDRVAKITMPWHYQNLMKRDVPFGTSLRR